jgi:phospholipid/cholesterol/gamma-HCH transport system substrate-binding protein
VGTFAFANFANPMQLICGSIGAVENATATETSMLCDDYLGPALRTTNLNYLPIPLNPLLGAAPPPQDLIYSEPGLAPGGSGPSPGPPLTPPAVSAYTGLNNDVPPPPGYVVGPPPTPFPPTDLPGMMLPPPATEPQSDVPQAAPLAPSLPAEAPSPIGAPQP